MFLLFPSIALANPKGAICGVQGNDDFSIAFDIRGSRQYQSVFLRQGSHGYTLWYTGPERSDSDYIFNEPNLAIGNHYNILITHEFNTDTLKYYRKLNSETYYVLIETKTLNLQQGQHWVVGSDTENVGCTDTVIEPPQPPEIGDVCEAFNSTIQTWYDDVGSGNGRLYISGNAQIRGAAINSTSGKRIVGFDAGKVFGDLTGPAPDYELMINAGCDNERCWGDPSLRVPRQTLESFPASSEFGMTSVTDAQTWLSGRQVEGILSVGGVLTLMSGTYWVDKVEIYGSGKIAVPEGEEVILNVKEMAVGGFLGMDIADIENNSQYDGYLRVNVYDSNYSNNPVKVNFYDTTFIGLLYSEASDTGSTDAVQLSGNSKIYGAVTAVSVQLNGSAQIMASSSCLDLTISEDNYTLVLSPQSDIALVCEDITPTVSVMDNGQLASSFTGTVVVNVDGVTQRYSGASNQFTVQSSGASKEVLVSAYIDGEQATLVRGSYEFVPYKFAADDQYVIADKPQQVTVKALACNDNGGVEDTGYTGSPTIQSTWLVPSSGASGNLTYTPQFSSGIANTQLTLDNAGKIEVLLEDSNFDCSGLTGCPIEGSSTLKGNFMVYSRPWTFALCSTSSTDIYSATGTSSGGNGFIAAGAEFDLQVLPIKYQAAISGEVESNSAWCNTANVTSNFFLDSSFSNHVALTSEVATPSAFTSTALLESSDVLVKPRVNSPNTYVYSGLYWNDVGSLKVMASTENYNATCTSPIGLESWYECTQLGYRNMGRFYPAYFRITTTIWDYPDTQEVDSYIYMEQMFEHVQFDVSVFNSNGGLTQNYGLFGDAYKVNFELSGDYADRLNIDDESEFGKSDWNGAVWSKSWDNSIEWSKVASPDGPFNSEVGESPIVTEIGLSIAGDDLIDPSEFKYVQQEENGNETTITSDSQKFLSQPDVRYGRIQLSDIGGSIGSRLTVPLRVEYWNGKRFTLHQSETGVKIEALISGEDVLWVSPENAAACIIALKVVKDDFGKPDNVSEIKFAQPNQGQLPNESNERLLAYQDCENPIRQQSQIWLDLDPSGNDLPWLKYNWDGDSTTGEENPSSVVTFGIYRGNDRVIYRGEPGLTSQ